MHVPRLRSGRGGQAGLMLFLSAALSACSLAPAYQPPQVASPGAYKELGPWAEAGASVVPPGRWWEAYGDPTLNDLEQRIEAGNPDLAAAAARYAQARGLLRQARSDLFPSLGIEGDVGHSRLSADRPLAGASASYTDVTLGASLGYELDLFGRVRNSVRASAADAAASEADVRAVRLGLQASLATNYFAMRGLDARAALLRQTVAAYQRAFDLTDTRHGGGIASGVDVSRAQSQLASARAELSAVAADRATYEHAIAVLAGETPSNFALASVETMPAPPLAPPGVPSALLERRPDIAAAERRMAAANARIGVARAALFPQVTLGGSAGFEATGGSILSASNGFWALGPLSAVLSVFDAGRRRAGVRIARAEYEETAANYRGTVLTAFREVEDDLALSGNLIQQEKDQGDAAAAAERTRDLALTRYRDGAADYLEVVTAQTAALDAERALLDLRARRLQLFGDTVRALGGAPTIS